MINIRTDLAMEAQELYNEREGGKKLDGVVVKKETKDEITVTSVEITDKESEEKIGKPMGKYITLESKRLKSLDPAFSGKISYLLKDELLKVINIKENDKVLTVGLGNRNITADALGPETISKIMVTNHLKEYLPEFNSTGLRPVSAISPGVLGITGVETSDIIKGIIEKSKPSLVIVIDALASRNPERINTTIQITDTGITPGSGVGNKREGLNKDVLGVPVVAIGMPTVADVMSVSADLTEKILKKVNNGELSDNQINEFIKQLYKDEEELIVTPKEIDSVISHISKVIANGINLSLHKDIDLEYIETFTF